MATINSSNIKDAGIVYCDGSGAFAGNNISAVTNTIASTDTNGDVILSPNGTGGVVAVTSLTIGNATKDVAFTINGASIAGTVSAEGLDAAVLGGIISHRHSSTAGYGGHFIGLRSRGTHASPTVVSADDTIGLLAFAAYDGTDYAQAAQILVAVDGTPGSDDMPGRIVFLTSADGAQTPTEALRIDNAQKVGVNNPTMLDEFNILGAMDIQHTAAASDDHALEIDISAAGFGDVKAIDVAYTTGALAAGSEEAVILVNVDEVGATGGEIVGYEMLSTAEGSDTKIGMKTGAGVEAIRQETGTFGDADNILNKAVDVTAALANGGAGNISVFVADNDTMTVGDAATFGEMEMILDTAASGSGIAPTFTFSTGGAGYSAFVPVDGTNGLRNNGVIDWDAADLSGWATATSGEYEIVITRTRNSLSTTPILDEVQIAALTEHKWDASGDVNVNSMDIAASQAYKVATVAILSDSAGTMTLSNIDALDATTETTIEAAIDTLANLTSAASLATVGTIGTGVWEGTDVGVAHGGTGRSTGSVAYSVICAGTTATGAQQNVAALGSSGHVLTSQGAGALPQFAAPTAATDVSDATFRIQDNGDDTKEIAFEASGITTGTVRTITMIDADITLLDPTNVNIDGGAIDGVTIGTNSACTELVVDDININGGTIQGTAAAALTIAPTAGQVLQLDDANFTVDGGVAIITGSLAVDDITLNGGTIQGTAASALAITPTAGQVLQLDDSNVTVDGGVVAITGDLTVDSININGATIGFGATGAIVIDTIGGVNFPLQPAFHVYNSVTDSNVTGNNTLYQTDWDTETFDQNGDFASDTYTSPLAGKHLFTCSLLVIGIIAADDCLTFITTSNVNFEYGYLDLAAVADIPNNMRTMSEFCEMDAADTCVTKIRTNGEGSDINDIIGGNTWTRFGGVMVC